MFYTDREKDLAETNPGLAFYWEEQNARRAPVPTRVHVINEHFAIEEFSNEHCARYYPAYRKDGKWKYFVHRDYLSMNFLQFRSLKEAQEFIDRFIACLQAFNNLAEHLTQLGA